MDVKSELPEFRYNPSSGDWVIIATSRFKRPHFRIKRERRIVQPKKDCPFCPERIKEQLSPLACLSRKEENSFKVQNMFKVLFLRYLAELKSNEFKNEEFRSFLRGMSSRYIKENSPVRIVIDFIAGMTDKFFLNQFNKIVLPKNFGLKLKKDK